VLAITEHSTDVPLCERFFPTACQCPLEEGSGSRICPPYIIRLSEVHHSQKINKIKKDVRSCRYEGLGGFVMACMLSSDARTILAVSKGTLLALAVK